MEEPESGVTKPSPTRASGDGARKLSPSPPPPPRVPRWLLLDRIVHRSRRHRGVVSGDATASALAHDCCGRPVRASLRIADPPAVSRLYVHLPGGPPVERFAEPRAIAAHRGCILFRMTVPFEDSERWHDTFSFPDSYFVYSCSSSPPSLTLLPACFHGGIVRPDKDKLYQPYRMQQQRSMSEEEIGILSHGDQSEFTVAQLTFSGPDEFELCVLHHPPDAPVTSTEWIVKKVKSPPNMEISAYSWWTDAVVPIGGRRLCWVDNYQGLLLVDFDVILADSNSKSNPEHQQWLRYIPLPRKALSRRPYRDGGSLDPLRCVSVTDAGVVKLVCILTKCPPSPYPFTIKTWTLDDIDKGRWTMDANATMGAEEFFRVLGDDSHSGLPRVQPMFPLVSLVDPDLVCFLLYDKDRDLYWIVEVNMRNKKLQSSAVYIREEEEEGYPPKRGPRNRFLGHHFIPSNFSSYLAEDAITSRKLSERMQKAKEERVLQKSGLETQLKK